MSKRPAHSILTSCPTSLLGWAILKDTSVFKQVVSSHNGTDGFGFLFRKMVINQASAGNNASDCHVELFSRLALESSSVLTWFKTLLGRVCVQAACGH